MKYNLAVDCGGTKVAGILYDDQYRPIKTCQVGSIRTTSMPPEYIEKNITGKETLLFKGSQYLEWIIEKLLLDPKDSKKLCRREKAAVARRKSWGLDS